MQHFWYMVVGHAHAIGSTNPPACCVQGGKRRVTIVVRKQTHLPSDILNAPDYDVRGCQGFQLKDLAFSASGVPLA